MNAAQDPEFSDPAETERIQFLFSRQLDGDLTPEESSELAALQHMDSHRAWLSAMADLRSRLKALPVEPVTASFPTSVQNAIHQAAITIPADSAPDPRRGRIMRGIVAVSVTACAAALILFLQPFDVERPVGTAQFTHTDDGNTSGTSVIVSPAAVVALDEESEAKSTSREARPHARVVADPSLITQKEEMRPFLENDQWRIVVVKVRSKDPEEVMQIIKGLLTQSGMDIQSVFGNKDQDHDARFGVLFTSTGDNDNAFIDNVISETEAQSTSLNPPSIGDSSSDSIIHRLQESMKSPTLSELHFGQVYMAQVKPEKSASNASDSLLAQSDAVKRASPPSAVGEKAAITPNDVINTPAVPSSARKTPVLVVFEFADRVPERI